jgi:hypothetical protein
MGKRYDERCSKRTRAGNACGLREGHPGKHINATKLERNLDGQRKRSRVTVGAKRADRLRWINLLKVGFGCADCPPSLKYYWPAEALQFDHLPGYTKVDNVSSLIANGSSIDTLFEEITKCDVVCANHHCIRTHSRRKGL